MSQYLVLSHIEIQNANSIAGLTWGFPAITQFLGFTHALSRKLSNHYEGKYDFELKGCGVISNGFEQHENSQDGGYSYRFTQRKFSYTFKPKKKDGEQIPPSIIEEGKMNLTVSLVIELDRSLTLTTYQLKELEQKILALCYCMRIAGGTVLNIKQAKLLSASTEKQHADMLRKIKRFTMPGFVLIDRKDYLQQHYQELLSKHNKEKETKDKPQLIDAWLNFSALKSEAHPELAKDKNSPDENTPASWKYVAKPNSGYLVPLMTGYKAISELYDPGQVLNTRDETMHSRFVEAIHSVGEWKGMHTTKDISAIIWRYHHDDQWYICKQKGDKLLDETINSKNNEIEETQTIKFNNALNLF